MPTFNEERQKILDQPIEEPGRLRTFLSGLGAGIAGRDVSQAQEQLRRSVVQPQMRAQEQKLKKIDVSEKAQNEQDEAEAARIFIKSLREADPDSIKLTDEQIDAMGPAALTKLAPKITDLLKQRQEREKTAREISKQAEVERHNRAMEAIGAKRAETTGKDKDAAITERADTKALSQLSTRIEKSGINQLEDRLDEIEHEFSLLPQTKPDKEGKTKPKDIPGYGRWESLKPTVLTTGQTRKIRGLVAGLANIQLKQRSGAAVTQQEFDRFRKEFGSGAFESEDALIQGLARLRSAIARDRQTIQAGYKPSVVEQYKEQYGSYDPEALTGPPPSGSGLTPEQRQARIRELRAKQGK